MKPTNPITQLKALKAQMQAQKATEKPFKEEIKANPKPKAKKRTKCE